MTDEAKQLIEHAALLERCIALHAELARRMEAALPHHDYMIYGLHSVTCGLCGSPAPACRCDVAAFDAALASIQAQARLCPHCGNPMLGGTPAQPAPLDEVVGDLKRAAGPHFDGIDAIEYVRGLRDMPVEADELQTWREREPLL